MANLYDLVSELIINTREASLGAFAPELVLCATILALLLFRSIPWTRRLDAAWVAVVGVLIALGCLAPWRLVGDPAAGARMELFTGMLVHDGFSVVMRAVLLSFLVLFLVFTRWSGAPRRSDAADIYVLILGATVGFCVMVSANHLLMVFMGVEMASVPSYVLAGMVRRERLASEASLKFAVYGAGTAGILLYGISLLAGLVNTVHLPSVADRLAVLVPQMSSAELTVLALACLLITVGLAFKLSAVPFHFWCPDVFAGATAEIGGFLSVASKAAALALLVRVVIGVGWIVPAGAAPGTAAVPALQALAPLRSVAGQVSLVSHTGQVGVAAASGGRDASVGAAAGQDHLAPVRRFLAHLVALLAVVTCTFGNLAAYGQTNMKRLLAYSTIAHAGYMMMAVPPLLAVAGTDVRGAEHAVAALVIYIMAYLFLNWGAFVVVAVLRNTLQSEEIADYAGLLSRCPGVVLCLAVMLLGLFGLPPLSGFVGKFAVFAALTEAFRTTGQFYLMVVLLIGGVNTALSLFYYLRIIRVMTLAPEPAGRAPCMLPITSAAGLYIAAVTLPTVFFLLGWEPLNNLALAAARSLFV
ncbi:MAG: NADH-quinone oxidoreductase subunit N [Pirellulaceae bacterium]|jgi:NADH-quinone oxidoreductase subunit N|nr:NADH-quinone oxidoreductase subunit N [Pirellulaceae bacterium]